VASGCGKSSYRYHTTYPWLVNLNLIALRHLINFSSGDWDIDCRNSDRASLPAAAGVDHRTLVLSDCGLLIKAIEGHDLVVDHCKDDELSCRLQAAGARPPPEGGTTHPIKISVADH